jgi:hypothetical protein
MEYSVWLFSFGRAMPRVKTPKSRVLVAAKLIFYNMAGVDNQTGTP